MLASTIPNVVFGDISWPCEEESTPMYSSDIFSLSKSCVCFCCDAACVCVSVATQLVCVFVLVVTVANDFQRYAATSLFYM